MAYHHCSIKSPLSRVLGLSTNLSSLPSPLNTWVRVLMALPGPFQVVLLHKNKSPTTRNFNCNHNCNYKLYLTRYDTRRARSQKVLPGARFGISIFDESHCVKNSKTLTFATVKSMHRKFKIELTGMPMHYGVHDWVVQGQSVAPRTVLVCFTCKARLPNNGYYL